MSTLTQTNPHPLTRVAASSIGGSLVTPAPIAAADAANNAQLAPPSFSGTFTYTVPTTSWSPPSFPTPAPGSIPSCSDDLCPSQNGQVCQDSLEATYGVLCDTRFSGTIIVSSGKHKEKAKKQRRHYAGTLDNCSGFCDMFSAANCVGLDYGQDGFCLSYAEIFGTLESPGEVALVRQA